MTPPNSDDQARPAPTDLSLLDYLDAALGLICNAHRARVDDVTEADGASPGWGEAARRWIDAYPRMFTEAEIGPERPTAGHAEFAAEVGRLREQQRVDAITVERDRLEGDVALVRRENAHLRTRVQLYRDSTLDAEKRLRHIDRILTTPPPVPTGDAWHAYDHERDQLAEQLAATPSRVGHSPSAHMLGQCACQRAAVGPA